MRSTFTLLIILFNLLACSDNQKSNQVKSKDPTEIRQNINENNLEIPDNRFSSSYEVLIFGNSHTARLDSLIKKLIRIRQPDAKVNVINGGGGFLDNITQRRIDLLENHPWTHVILQGQKYSQSGNYIYPTTAAQMWIDKAKRDNITPILFPEHPQKGNRKEGRRVHSIHTTIADLQRSCVAPIGLTWDKVINIEPQLILHINDGNHANFIGKLLTAFVFYEVITGESADLLPFIDEIDVEESVQQILKQLASETIQSNQPCMFGA